MKKVSISTFSFSARDWIIKEYETTKWGPGENYFSSHPDDIWVDQEGNLHLTINKRNGKWYSTEVIARESTGYGTYTFVIRGDLGSLSKNVTIGLFTWNDNSFEEAGNSELDIEISKWGESSESQWISYAVQPIGVDPVHSERVKKISVTEQAVLNGSSTHELIWKPDRIRWRSFRGVEKTDKNLIAEWHFTDENPKRAKTENGITSNAFVIPEPGQDTRARINFWIQRSDSPGPSDGRPHEIIIESFEFIPHAIKE